MIGVVWFPQPWAQATLLDKSVPVQRGKMGTDRIISQLECFHQFIYSIVAMVQENLYSP
jgi:hypothetical protein